MLPLGVEMDLWYERKTSLLLKPCKGLSARWGNLKQFKSSDFHILWTFNRHFLWYLPRFLFIFSILLFFLGGSFYIHNSSPIWNFDLHFSSLQAPTCVYCALFLCSINWQSVKIARLVCSGLRRYILCFPRSDRLWCDSHNVSTWLCMVKFIATIII